MRRLASGVSLITTVENGEPFGMIATAINSVCAEPPALLICVNSQASSHDPISRSGVFCVNFLASDDSEITERFSSSQFRSQRFQGGNWRTLQTGAPAHVNALASFDCRVIERVVISSHTIFVGVVEAMELWTEQCLPLVYLDGRYCQTG